MPALAQAHLLRVYVGNDLADFSRGLIRFDINHQKRDRTGLFLLEGEIELALVDGLPESIDPRKNPSRWARGNSVRVDIQKSTGDWVTHPFGNLVILNPPEPIDLAEPRITLEVGCKLAYRNSQTVASVVQLNNPTRTQMIDALLAAALIPDFVGTIDEYPFTGTTKIASENNAISTAGAIAWSAGYALWQNRDGEVDAVPLGLNATDSPDLTFSVLPSTEHVSAVGYASNAGEDLVAETVTAREVDSKRKTFNNYQEIVVVTEEFGSSKAIDNAASGNSVLLKRTTIRDNQTANAKIRTELIEVAEGLILGNKKFTMQIESETTERWAYEGGDEGKLVFTERTVLQAFASALSSFWSATQAQREATTNKYTQDGLQLIVAEDSTTTYNYDEVNQVVQSIFTETLKPKASIAPDEYAELVQASPTSPPSDITVLVIGKRERVTYKEARPREWLKITSIQEPFGGTGKFPPESSVPIADRINYRLTLGNSTTTTEISNSGQTQPPAPERKPPEITEEETKPEKATSTLVSAQAPQDTKQKDELEVQYCSSIDQLKPLAELENKLIHGRRSGQLFQLPCTDWFIDNGRPCFVFHAIEPDGSKIVYWVDTLTFTHDLESSIVSAEGVWLGTIPVGETDVVLPYQILAQLQSGAKWGVSAQTFPYSTTTTLINFSTGIKWGNYTQPLLSASTGFKWGESGFVAIQGSQTGWKWGNYYELITPEPPASIWTHAWTFESPDPLNDKIGSSHLTLNAEGSSSAITGIYGDGRRIFYNSGNAILSTSRQTDLNFDGDFVFAFWFKWEDFNAFNFAVGIFNATNTGYFFDDSEFFVWHRQIEGSAFVGWRTLTESYSIGPFDFPNGVAEGDWIHVICEYNGTADQLTFTVFNATTSDEVIDSNRSCSITPQATQPFAILTEWDSRFDGLHFVKGVSSLTTGEKQDIRNGEYPFS